MYLPSCSLGGESLPGTKGMDFPDNGTRNHMSSISAARAIQALILLLPFSIAILLVGMLKVLKGVVVV